MLARGGGVFGSDGWGVVEFVVEALHEVVASEFFAKLEHEGGVEDVLVAGVDLSASRVFEAVALVPVCSEIGHAVEEGHVVFLEERDGFIDGLPGIKIDVFDFERVDADVAHEDGKAGGEAGVAVAKDEVITAHFVEIGVGHTVGISLGVFIVAIKISHFNAGGADISTAIAAGEASCGHDGNGGGVCVEFVFSWAFPYNFAVKIPTAIKVAYEGADDFGIELVSRGEEGDFFTDPWVEGRCELFLYPAIWIERLRWVIEGLAWLELAGIGACGERSEKCDNNRLQHMMMDLQLIRECHDSFFPARLGYFKTKNAALEIPGRRFLKKKN